MPYTILVFDVDRYGDPSRTDFHRTAVHNGLNRAVRRAFAEAAVEWDSCDWQDGGDGGLILIPVTTPKVVVLNRVVRNLADAVREHNEVSAAEARIRLRLCLHAADVRRAEYGVVGSGIILVSRLLASAELRNECRNSPEPVTLAVTDGFFREVVRHDPVAEPGKFREIRFRVKETETAGWVKTAWQPPPAAPAEPFADRPDRLTALVEALLEVPSVQDEVARRALLELLPRPIGGSVRYQPRARPHVFELVRTCRDYDRGIAALFIALRKMEGDSAPVRRAEAAAREWTTGEDVIG
ncbi:hypothetical protein FHS29_006154 [Saccharothrix tamanrassetensis]|uniref:Effector-associated domain-containing protein n=1 Tax=Saccharothrix tamanrassetensis TaxID=1051531 RepID=A0A841CRN3_9PSEU|nr:hypothetical protein [Saccharothrix tamanrassetensis]MBB5959533.1 hypothetical protein [Saccharothrix tamanrassetensis]